MLLKLCHSVILSLLIGLSLSAQQVVLTELPTQELLPVAHIHRMFQDSEGYMWYATEQGGLCRDNGYQVDVFRADLNTPHLLASNTITCITEDKVHKIWFGTEKGLYVLDKSDYRITGIPDAELVGRKIDAVRAASDGTVWVATRGMIFHYSAEGERLGGYPSQWNKQPKSVSDFYEDSRHVIWVLQWEGGLLRYIPDTDSFSAYEWPCAAFPVQMVEDVRNHCYWVATWGQGVVCFVPSDNPAEGNVIVLQPATLEGTSHNPHKAQVLGLLQDSRQGFLWVSAMDNLYVYRVMNGKLLAVSTDAFLPRGRKILDRLIEDRSGNIRVPGYSPHSFILSFEKNKIQRYPVSAMTEATGYPVMADRVLKEGDYYWIWQGRTGLSLYDAATDRISFVSEFPEINDKYRLSKSIEKCRSDKGIWAYHRNKLLHIQHDGMRMLLKEEVAVPGDGRISAIYEDDRNRLWIGTDSVLYRYAVLGAQMEKTGNVDGRIQGIAVSNDDNVYCFTSGQKFVRITPDGKLLAIAQGEDYSSVVIAVDGTVWTATLQGSVYSYRPQTGDYRLEADASNRNGDGVKGLEADAMGHIWMLSDQYVKEYNPANRSFRILRNSDRLVDVDYFLSIDKPDDGQICLGGIGAFCMVASSAELNLSADDALCPLISAVKIGGGRHLTGMDEREVEIAPDESGLEISFSTLNHLYARKISYAYRLKGWEEAWTYLPQGINTAYFSKLPHGNYTLELKATDAHGCWGEPADCLMIHRLPAWYETWWAYAAYLFTGLALLAGIWWLDNRIRYLISLQQKRKEIFLTGVEVRPADIASSKPNEEFLKKAVASVERNIDNSDYSVERLSRDLCMSRMNLYRKLQSLTGQKPNEFIRSIRLKRAARLLVETGLSVVEIAEKVGFSTPSYFTKCFKDMFGVLPTQYGKHEDLQDL